MSDHFLRMIPTDPSFVPPTPAQEAAVALLQSYVPNADQVRARVLSGIEFVDPGSNLESVTCPLCGSDITDTFGDLFDQAFEHTPPCLALVMPCCGGGCSLNSLRFDAPAGFAHFVLEARNASLGGVLAAPRQAALESVLGCSTRQVLAHY